MIGKYEFKSIPIDLSVLTGVKPVKRAEPPVADVAMEQIQKSFAALTDREDVLHSPFAERLISNEALTAMRMADQNAKRRDLMHSLQALNHAVGADQSVRIAAMDDPFADSLKNASLAFTQLQRQILLNARNTFRDMGKEADRGLWGTSDEVEAALKEKFTDLRHQLEYAIAHFDVGDTKTAFAEHAQAMTASGNPMIWMGHALNVSTHKKWAVNVGITLAAGTALAIVSGGSAFALGGTTIVSNLGVGAQFTSRLLGATVFIGAERKLQDVILNIPMLHKEGVLPNVMDITMDVLKTAALMGWLEGVGRGVAKALPTDDVAMAAVRNFTAECVAMDFFSVATGMDPKLLASLDYHTDKMAFLLGLRVGGGVIQGVPAMIKAGKVALQESAKLLEMSPRPMKATATESAMVLPFLGLDISTTSAMVVGGIAVGAAAVGWWRGHKAAQAKITAQQDLLALQAQVNRLTGTIAKLNQPTEPSATAVAKIETQLTEMGSLAIRWNPPDRIGGNKIHIDGDAKTMAEWIKAADRSRYVKGALILVAGAAPFGYFMSHLNLVIAGHTHLKHVLFLSPYWMVCSWFVAPYMFSGGKLSQYFQYVKDSKFEATDTLEQMDRPPVDRFAQVMSAWYRGLIYFSKVKSPNVNVYESVVETLKRSKKTVNGVEYDLIQYMDVAPFFQPASKSARSASVLRALEKHGREWTPADEYAIKSLQIRWGRDDLKSANSIRWLAKHGNENVVSWVYTFAREGEGQAQKTFELLLLDRNPMALGLLEAEVNTGGISIVQSPERQSD